MSPRQPKQDSIRKNKEARYHRQLDLVPLDELEKHQVAVVGLGAVGRQVVMLLASMGIERPTLVDFDTVDMVNISTQGYLEEDIGKPKVEAAANHWLKVNPKAQPVCLNERVHDLMRLGDTIFCCVDSMSGRKQVWEAAGRDCWYWADGRMGEEVVLTFSAYDNPTRDYYQSSLITDEEAKPIRCTAQGTLYMAYLASSLMVGGFARRLRKVPVTAEVCFNMLADVCSVKDGKREQPAS